MHMIAAFPYIPAQRVSVISAGDELIEGTTTITNVSAKTFANSMITTFLDSCFLDLRFTSVFS
jgi:hypothetical protein